MTKLSKIALEKCTGVIQAIKTHPFNIELADGSLPRSSFAFYIEQDTVYLKDYAKSLAMIASKVPLKFTKDFLNFSENALIAEQEVVHHFFRKHYQLKETGQIAPATLCYTSYLLQTCSIGTVETAIAAVLPCFWVYRIVGQYIAQNTNMDSPNPYKKWVETYSSEAFSKDVERAIDIFDEMAQSASENARQSMLDAFYKSTVLEWHFWNDSYHQTVFDSFINSPGTEYPGERARLSAQINF